MITIEDFCEKHGACVDGKAWAVVNCKTMDDVWATAKPEWLLWVATREGVLTDRELRLLVVWAARQVQHLMTDPRSISALDVAERFANGQATSDELSAASYAAWAAASDAASYAAWAAASDAASDAAWAAASAAARAAARAAVLVAASDAAWAAASAAAWAAAQLKQAAWMRKNCKPNFA